MKKEKNKILDIDTNTTSNNLLKFPKKVTNKNKPKKYESFIVVSETEDSIYSPQYEEIIKLDGGKIYVAEDEIREIVQDELAKYFNGVNFNKNES